MRSLMIKWKLEYGYNYGYAELWEPNNPNNWEFEIHFNSMEKDDFLNLSQVMSLVPLMY